MDRIPILRKNLKFEKNDLEISLLGIYCITSSVNPLQYMLPVRPPHNFRWKVTHNTAPKTQRLP